MTPTPTTPVCRSCGDTHMVWHESSGQSFMCTSCPVPCQACRSGGNGPFCEKTPCNCACHKKHRNAAPSPALPVVTVTEDGPATGPEWQRTRTAYAELTDRIAKLMIGRRINADLRDKFMAVDGALNEMMDACHAYRDAMASALSAAPATTELDAYDAGILNDYGGGNVEWWQDYIRAELGRAHDFYQSQVSALSVAGGGQIDKAIAVLGRVTSHDWRCSDHATALKFDGAAKEALAILEALIPPPPSRGGSET